MKIDIEILIIGVVLSLTGGFLVGYMYEYEENWEIAQINFDRGIDYSMRYDLKSTYQDKYNECLEYTNGMAIENLDENLPSGAAIFILNDTQEIIFCYPGGPCPELYSQIGRNTHK